MGPIASRNIANALIIVGLLPVHLWLFLVTYDVMHPGHVLPWVSAGILMFGVPIGLLSAFMAIPAMMFARSRAAMSPGIWTIPHQLPFFLGLVTFAIFLIVGVLIVTINIRW